jgi:hypothetical protein
MQRLYVLILEKAFCRDAIYRVSRLVHFARGIAAEPPARRAAAAGDGADSPTRATKKTRRTEGAKRVFFVREAARPNH